MVRNKDVGGEPSDERRVAVLLERIQSDVQTVMEGHSGLVKRLEQLEMQADVRYQDLKRLMLEGFEKVWDDFGKVDTQFGGVNSRLDVLTTRLDAFTHRFDAHEQAHGH